MTDAQITPGEFVQSLERGLAVIRAFGPGRSRLTLSEIARATGLTPAAARRFLLTLRTLGYIASEGRSFSLRPKLLELGYSYLASLPWWRHGQTVVERIGGATGLPCGVGVLDRDAIVFVAIATATGLPLSGRGVGMRLPAYATAVGRVLLAGLEPTALDEHLATWPRHALTPLTVVDERRLRVALRKVSALGYSYSKQDLEIGLASLGVPVRDRAGTVVAGLSLSFGATALSRDDALAQYRALLDEGAAEVGESLAT